MPPRYESFRNSNLYSRTKTGVLFFKVAEITAQLALLGAEL
jgi:hypothetical protein